MSNFQGKNSIDRKKASGVLSRRWMANVHPLLKVIAAQESCRSSFPATRYSGVQLMEKSQCVSQDDHDLHAGAKERSRQETPRREDRFWNRRSRQSNKPHKPGGDEMVGQAGANNWRSAGSAPAAAADTAPTKTAGSAKSRIQQISVPCIAIIARVPAGKGPNVRQKAGREIAPAARKEARIFVEKDSESKEADKKHQEPSGSAQRARRVRFGNSWLRKNSVPESQEHQAQMLRRLRSSQQSDHTRTITEANLGTLSRYPLRQESARGPRGTGEASSSRHTRWRRTAFEPL